ncbi:MAG: aldolase/citrate lyase family protein [Acutalibacteraceae bacterium]
MSIKFMYITNKPRVAQIAEANGVDRIFVDLEYIGKSDRQGGMDTVQSFWSVEDVKNIRGAINKAELLVRCNPIHNAAKDYCSSKDEIDAIIAAGADIVMLPYFKTVDEVKAFIDLVGGRAKTMPLVETPEAVEKIDEILELPGIDEIYVGLNDLSIGYNMKFMFQPLADGTVDRLAEKFKAKGIPFGFGGVASIGHGTVHAEMVIREHYRIGSTCAILSRSFCNVDKVNDINKINTLFVNGMKEIRSFEKSCENDSSCFEQNRQDLISIVNKIVSES